MRTESIRARTAGACSGATQTIATSAASRASGRSCRRAHVVYVGDGYSDRCAALAADRVFATAGLARYLAERGTPFEPFSDFHALSDALLDHR